MKKLLRTIIVLAMASVGWGADKYATFDSDGGDGSVGNPYTLAEAATNCAGNTIYLGAGTYTLAADFVIAGNSTWIAQGVVVIDGEAGATDYQTYIQNATVTITGTATNTITFQNGKEDNVTVKSTTAATTVTMSYCNFTAAQGTAYGGNGCQISSSSPAAIIILTLNNCNSYANVNDGFSLVGGTITYYQYMYLNNCTSYNNGGKTGASDGDGITCHNTNQIINVNGGSFYENEKTGIAAAAGSVYVNNAAFYSNGDVETTFGNAYIDAGTAYFQGCTFSQLDNTASADYHILTGTTANSLRVDGCVFSAATGKGGNMISLGTTSAVVTNSIFKDQQLTACFGITMSTGGTTSLLNASNNVFYNCKNGIYIRQTVYSHIIENNIFHTCGETAAANTGGAIVTRLDNGYYLNNGNGYNCFYNSFSGQNFQNFNVSWAPNNQLHTTDVTVDPQFKNAANGDFSLLSSSPLINAGKATPNSGYTTIGAWQPEAGASEIFRNRRGL